MGEQNDEPIRFYGIKNEYAFLSNFYPHPETIGGVTYNTNEHFFQASKAVDSAERKRIAQAVSPEAAKALGRKCRIVPNWNSLRDDVMLSGLRAKFSSPEMRKKLLSTGSRTLIEASPRDSYWGAARGGANRLGKLLMELRSELSSIAEEGPLDGGI